MAVRSVLVIDDDPGVREYFKRNLRAPGIKVTLALNAKYGMEELEHHSFDCIFCDLRMPIISGEEVLKHVLDKYPTTPVIVMTEYGKADAAVEFIKKGAFDYLAKPIPKDTILKTVGRAADHKAKQEQEQRKEREKDNYSDKLQQRILEMNRQIISQCEFVNKLNGAQTMKGILALIELFTKTVLKCERVVTMLLMDDDFGPDEFRRLTNVPKRCFGVAAEHDEKLAAFMKDKLGSIYNPSSAEADFLADIPYDAGTFDLKRSLFIPLSANDQALGVIIIYEDHGHERNYTEQEKLQLLFIAEAASTAIHNCLKSLKLEKGYLDTVLALTRAVEAKDPYTCGHSDRVRGYAIRMARRLGLSDERIKYIDIAGILHDVGKIGIPLDIINKKMKLDQQEYERIKAHPVIGEMMISHIKFLRPVRKIIRQHHERFDGKGYPDGISGEDITMEGRIMAVADSYDAMTSDRPYRKAMSPYEAYLELERNAGTQFDPKCVAALGEIVRENLLYLSAV